MNNAGLQDHSQSDPAMPAPLRLLILEDRPADAELMVHQLERSGFAPSWQRVETEQEFVSALVPELDLVLADYQLPHYDALRALARMRLSGSETPFIIVSGTIQEDLAVEAMRHGAADFLIKDRMARLGPAVVHALEERRLREDNRRAHEGLRRFEELSRLIISTAHELARLTPQYERLSALAHELAAMLCQVGYVTIPAPVLAKFRANLTLRSEEKDMLARIPRTGADLLANIPRLEGVADIVLNQNKNFDGTGFPVGPLSHEEIPLGSRVLRVLTDLIALEERGHARPKALAEMQARPGVYDPRVLESVSVCFDVFMSDRAEPGKAVQEITIKELCVRHLLVDKIETLDGVMLVGGGRLVTPMLLEKLKNFAAINGIREPIRVQ